MEKYEALKLDVIEFEGEDIITDSYGGGGDTTTPELEF